jgi:hypothetical protein
VYRQSGFGGTTATRLAHGGDEPGYALRRWRRGLCGLPRFRRGIRPLTALGPYFAAAPILGRFLWLANCRWVSWRHLSTAILAWGRQWRGDLSPSVPGPRQAFVQAELPTADLLTCSIAGPNGAPSRNGTPRFVHRYGSTTVPPLLHQVLDPIDLYSRDRSAAGLQPPSCHRRR